MTENEWEAFVEDLESDTEAYASLITEKNYEREKYMLFVRSMLKPAMGLQELIDSFNNVYDLDGASGVQLDEIGAIVGASRLLSYKPQTGTREMDDDEFRIVIKLTIAMNAWNGTLGELEPLYKNIFGDTATIRYIDNQDMTVTINVYGDLSTRETEILEKSGLLLVPVGVGKEVIKSGEDVVVSLYAGLDISGIERVDTVIVEGDDN